MKVHHTQSAFAEKLKSNKKKERKLQKNGIKNGKKVKKQEVKNVEKKKLRKSKKKMKLVTKELEVENVSVKEMPKKKRRKSSETENNINKTSDLKDSTDVILMDKAVPNEELDLDSNSRPEQTFKWFINPIIPADFFRDIWEKKPMLIRRHNNMFYKNLFTCNDFNNILKREEIFFTTNIDVVVYKDGQRHTLNPEGRAYPNRVWSEFKNGCSIRMLNPQTFSKNVWQLNANLQEFFNCGVGANMYLTPAGSQGFAPHFDDIEAFVIQLEGKKHWRLYNPRDDSETLPRISSGNFTQEEIGEPILDVVLEEGDLLYFPRGTIHQAYTPDDTHSLHLTVSTYQKNSWADLLTKLVPRALEVAIEEDVEFRKGIPNDYLSYMGVTNSDINDPRRQKFTNIVQKLLEKVISTPPLDAACDQLSKEFIHNCLPPAITKDETNRSIFGHESRTNDGDILPLEFQNDVEIRLTRKNILRLVAEEQLIVYHSVDNSRVYHEREIQGFVIDDKFAPALEALQHSYPKFVSIDQLSIDDFEDRVEFMDILFNRGLIIMKEAMQKQTH